MLQAADALSITSATRTKDSAAAERNLRAGVASGELPRALQQIGLTYVPGSLTTSNVSIVFYCNVFPLMSLILLDLCLILTIVASMHVLMTVTIAIRTAFIIGWALDSSNVVRLCLQIVVPARRSGGGKSNAKRLATIIVPSVVGGVLILLLLIGCCVVRRPTP